MNWYMNCAKQLHRNYCFMTLSSLKINLCISQLRNEISHYLKLLSINFRSYLWHILVEKRMTNVLSVKTEYYSPIIYKQFYSYI